MGISWALTAPIWLKMALSWRALQVRKSTCIRYYDDLNLNGIRTRAATLKGSKPASTRFGGALAISIEVGEGSLPPSVAPRWLCPL